MVQDQAKATRKIISWQVEWHIAFQPKIVETDKRENLYTDILIMLCENSAWQDEYRNSPSIWKRPN